MAFFQINEGATIFDGSKMVGKTAIRRIIYTILDYWSALACATLVGFLNFLNMPFWAITLGTWAFDFIVAAIFLIISEKGSYDITLGESFRRAADVIHSNSKTAGWLFFVFLTGKATIWDGPELVVIFFKKELGSIIKMTLALIPLTLFQGIFWAAIYSLGYESISELIGMFSYH